MQYSDCPSSQLCTRMNQSLFLQMFSLHLARTISQLIPRRHLFNKNTSNTIQVSRLFTDQYPLLNLHLVQVH